MINFFKKKSDVKKQEKKKRNQYQSKLNKKQSGRWVNPGQYETFCNANIWKTNIKTSYWNIV